MFPPHDLRNRLVWGGAGLPPHHGGEAKIMGGKPVFGTFPPHYGGETSNFPPPSWGGNLPPPSVGGKKGRILPFYGGERVKCSPHYGGVLPPHPTPHKFSKSRLWGERFLDYPPTMGGKTYYGLAMTLEVNYSSHNDLYN